MSSRTEKSIGNRLFLLLSLPPSRIFIVVIIIIANIWFVRTEASAKECARTHTRLRSLHTPSVESIREFGGSVLFNLEVMNFCLFTLTLACERCFRAWDAEWNENADLMPIMRRLQIEQFNQSRMIAIHSFLLWWFSSTLSLALVRLDPFEQSDQKLSIRFIGARISSPKWIELKL